MEARTRPAAVSRASGSQEEHGAAPYACADAVWRYFIQRETPGLVDRQPVIEYYAIPDNLLSKVGARPRTPVGPGGTP